MASLRNNRTRKVTRRFGNATEYLPGESSEEDVFVDDSMEDPNFSPEKDAKIVGTSSKKHFVNNCRNTDIHIDQFDDLFDNIDCSATSNDDSLGTSVNKLQTNPSQTNTSEISQPQNEVEEIAEKTRTSVNQNQINLSHISISEIGQPQDEVVEITQAGSVAALEAKIDVLLQIIRNSEKRNDEILARVTVLESYLIENGLKPFETHRKKNQDYGSSSQYGLETNQAFLTSIGLPFKQLEEWNKFELNLSNTQYKKTVVSALSCVSIGKRFESSDKYLKRIFCMLMDRIFLSDFTWTGKSRAINGVPTKKIAFKKFQNVNEMLVDTVRSKDSRFNRDAFEDIMINNILKYAER